MRDSTDRHKQMFIVTIKNAINKSKATTEHKNKHINTQNREKFLTHV